MDLTKCNYVASCKKYKNNNCPLNNMNIDPFCIKLFKINALQDEALLTEKQKEHYVIKLDKEGTDRNAFDRLKEIELSIEEWVSNGGNLYIYSRTPGNCKSKWAEKLLKAFIDTQWYKSDLKCRCLFINVSKFLIALKDSISERQSYIDHIKNNVLDADLVVWDDIATKGFTQFEMEHLFSIINHRIDAGKANIYTSNLAGKELQEAMGDRLYSRVAHMSELVEFKGSDKRGIKI